MEVEAPEMAQEMDRSVLAENSCKGATCLAVVEGIEREGTVVRFSQCPG